MFSLGDKLIGTFELDLEKSSFYSKIQVLKALTEIRVDIKNGRVKVDSPSSIYSSIDRVYEIVEKKIRTEVEIADKQSLLDKYPELFEHFEILQQQPNSNEDSSKQYLRKIYQIYSEKVQLADSNLMKEVGFLETEQDRPINKEFNPFGTMINNNFEVHQQYSQKSDAFRILSIVLFPKYKLEIANDEEAPLNAENGEKGELPPELPIPHFDAIKVNYQAVGFDTYKRRGNKHYRLRLNGPLEKQREFFEQSLIPRIPIKKGKAINVQKKGFFDYFVSSGDSESQKEVGRFKGSALVLEEEVVTQLHSIGVHNELNNYGIPTDFKSWENGALEKDFLTEVCTIVNVYILEGRITVKADMASENDTFLKIMLGDQQSDSKNKVINDKQNPIFNQSFQYIIFNNKVPAHVPRRLST